jgi:predicted transglutaminase-like cysteine proteinase
LRRLVQAVLVVAAGVASNPVEAAPVSLFGTAEFRVDSLAELPQWQRVLRRAEAEEGAVRACVEHAERCPNRATRAWASLLRGVAHLSSRAQVEAVHRFVNERKYRADADNYGLSDYWATPLEFFRRSGDCEDNVIAKYRSLRLLGMPADRLRMVVQDVVRDLPHAVLAVYIEDEALILDNLSPPVLTQDRVVHYVPHYSVNERARWVHTPADLTVTAAMLEDVQPARP